VKNQAGFGQFTVKFFRFGRNIFEIQYANRFQNFRCRVPGGPPTLRLAAVGPHSGAKINSARYLSNNESQLALLFRASGARTGVKNKSNPTTQLACPRHSTHETKQSRKIEAEHSRWRAAAAATAALRFPPLSAFLPNRLL
jgi:hypothetical protein